jgi:hypothetical protein
MKREGLSEEMQKSLREKAEAYLSSPLYAVTERMTRAISGNIHDYSSIGTYWWPNPDTPDGLPYVRRDGEVTPLAKDEMTHRLMARKVLELTLAAFYLDDEKYARGAVKALYDWHLNPETYMTPNAEYAQSIPGICSGRGIGIIDFAYSYQIFDSVAILEWLGFIDGDTVTALKEWYRKFTDWMLTSENGITEDTELNNHGTFYDVQILAMAIFTEREALVKKICTTAYERRFRSQIEPDGRMPLELARTMAMHYSFCNIRGLSLIANMAEIQGYDEFVKPDKERGVCLLKSAIDYITPFVTKPETFPYAEMFNDEVYPSIPYFALMSLTWANAHFENEGYEERIKELGENSYLLRPGK